MNFRSYYSIVILFVLLVSVPQKDAFTQSVRVKDYQKISDTQGNFTGELRSLDLFGTTVANLGDIDKDGVTDIGVGTHDDDGGFDRGALWVLLLNADGTVKHQQKISDSAGGFTGVLDDSDVFGDSITSLGDLDGDGIHDLAVAAPGDDDGGNKRGAIWILFLNSDGTVKQHQKISDTEGNLNANLQDFDGLGNPANIGDLDGDGVVDLVTGSFRKNKLWILFLNSDGTVKSHQVISASEGGFTGILKDTDGFGIDVSPIGDVNADGINDIIVGAISDSDGASSGFSKGAAWIIFLNKNGTVKGQQKISELAGGFQDEFVDGQDFGTSVTGLGDLNNDGIPDVAVGARNRVTDFEPNTGDAWIIFLHRDGTVKASQKIREGIGGFSGNLDGDDDFGSGIAGLGDLNGDGVPDLAIAALADDDGGVNRGAVWIMFLDVPAVHNFTLIDSATDQPIAGFDPIHEGAVLNLKHVPRQLNIRANTTGYVKSVRFAFANNSSFHTENEAPYALFGDANGNYFDGRLRLGPQKLTATPFTENEAQGESGNQAQLSFTVIRDDEGLVVTRYVLVNADTDADIQVLHDNDILDMAKLPTRINVRAEVAGPVESVRLTLEPKRHRMVENAAPYALFGDHAGDYAIGTFYNGNQTLTAFPFSKDNGQGQVGTPLTIGLNVINGVAVPGGAPDQAIQPLLSLSHINDFALESAYPNPFNPVTTIRFAVPEASHIKLTVFDLLGREVKTLVDRVIDTGMHEVNFDAHSLPSGTYLYRMDTPEHSFTRTMLLMK